VQTPFDLWTAFKAWTASASAPVWISAVATIAYTIVTGILLSVTKGASRAASKSADAAKVSADIARESFAATQRPYVGISKTRLENDFNAERWILMLQLDNFGSLPANDVTLTVRVALGDEVLLDVKEPPIEIFPRSPSQFRGEIPVNRRSRDSLSEHSRVMTGSAVITYDAPLGGSFEHRTEFKFNMQRQGFEITAARTSTRI
jgi:hypothetical protein